MASLKVKVVNQIQVTAEVLVIPTEIKTMEDLRIYPSICGYKTEEWFEELSLLNGMGSIDYSEELLLPIKLICYQLGLYPQTDNIKLTTIELPDGRKISIEFILNYLPVIFFEGLHEGDGAIFRIPYKLHTHSGDVDIEFLMELILAQKKYLIGKSFEEHVFHMTHKYNSSH